MRTVWTIGLGRLQISFWRERAGVISDMPVWCCGYGCWLHVCGSWRELLWDVIRNWKSDRNLVG